MFHFNYSIKHKVLLRLAGKVPSRWMIHFSVLLEERKLGRQQQSSVFVMLSLGLFGVIMTHTHTHTHTHTQQRCVPKLLSKEIGQTFLTSYLMANLTRLSPGRLGSSGRAWSTSPFKMASTSSVSLHKSRTPTTKSLHCIDSFL